MEEILPTIRSMLKEAIIIENNDCDLSIMLNVKPKVDIKGKLADPEEVKIMLHIFGGLERDFPVEIQVNDQDQNIYMRFQDKNDYDKVKEIMETIWDNAVDLFEQTIGGDFSGIKRIEDIDS